MNMNASLLESAITDKTKAIMPVGIYGQTSDMKAICEIANGMVLFLLLRMRLNHLVPLIMAKNHVDFQKLEALLFSLQSHWVVTVMAALYLPIMIGLPNSCADCVHGQMKSIIIHARINGRLDSIQAAIVVAKMAIFDGEILKGSPLLRLTIRDLIVMALRFLGLPREYLSVYAQYTILCNDRDKVQSALSAADVPSVAYYAVPLHLQQVFQDLGYEKGDFPVTEMVSEKCLSLPMNPYLTEEEIEKSAALYLNKLYSAILTPKNYIFFYHYLN